MSYIHTMKHSIAAIVMMLLVATTSAFASDGNRPAKTVTLTPVVPGVVYVQLRAGSVALIEAQAKAPKVQSFTNDRYHQILNALQVTTIVPFDAHAPKDNITTSLGIDRMYVIYYKNHSINPHTAVRELLATSQVEKASSRYMFPVKSTPNDPDINSQYALTKMHVFDAWNYTMGDSNIVIADVDCATNIDHEDLKGEVKYNTGELGTDANGHDKRSNGIDDDNDGAIDNYEGWDIVGNVAQGAPFKPDNDPRPDVAAASHGTMTAGCILATANNGKGGTGVAPGCRLLAIKASSDPDYIEGGYEGIHYAATHGARIANCSWGGPAAAQEIQYANVFLQEAIDRNMLVVAASGNEGADLDVNQDYPASGPGVLSVGATDANDAPASFGNYGHLVSVYAPGVSVLSTGYPGNSTYTAEDGTSFSSPLTAGVAGLVASLHPTWSPKFIARQIIQTCDNVVKPTDRYNYWGRVNASNAVSTPGWPGLIVTQYAINGVVNDSLGLPNIQQDFQVTFKNVVATGSNIYAELVPGPGYTVSGDPVLLGSMLVNATAVAPFKITRTNMFSDGDLPVRVFVHDASALADTLTFNVPLKRIQGFVPNMLATDGSSVYRVDNSTAWASYGLEQTGIPVISQFAFQAFGQWDSTYSLGEGTVAPYCVEGRSVDEAYFGTGPQSGVATIYHTKDGGATFDISDVSDITKFVNTIHFFSADSGIFIGDPITSHWGIGTTTDGGKTWLALAKPSAVSVTESSWNNGTCWVGDNGWFGSNKYHIWHSTDRGATWKSTGMNFQNILSVAFADDATHGFACARKAASSGGTASGTDGLMTSIDGGQTWKTIAQPDGMIPGAVQFIPDTTIAIITSDRGVYETADFGASWTQLPMPTTYDANSADLSISRGDGQVVISMLSQKSGVATYTMSMPDPVHSSVAPTNQLALTLNPPVPNPTTSVATVSFELPERGQASLQLYDPLGRVVETLLDRTVEAGRTTATLSTENLPAGSYYLVLQSAAGDRVSRTVSVVH